MPNVKYLAFPCNMVRVRLYACFLTKNDALERILGPCNAFSDACGVKCALPWCLHGAGTIPYYICGCPVHLLIYREVS